MLDVSPPSSATARSLDGARLADCLLRGTAALAVLVLDGDLRVQDAGPGVQTLLGWEPEELRGTRVEELVVATSDDEAGFGPAERSGRWLLRNAAGGARLTATTWSPALDDDGALLGGVLSAADVEAGDAAKLRITESDAQFRQVFDKSPTAIALVGLAPSVRGRIRRANAALEAFTGRRRRELFSMAVADLLHPDEVEAHLGYLRRAAEEGLTEPDGVLRRFQHRDGSVRYGRKSTALVVPAGSHEPHLLVHLHDVTEQVRAQEALAHSALHDALTGLANRALFADRLEHALATEEREKRGLTLLYADLDHFKPVNDVHGHAAGDAVLVEVARRLVGAVREVDTVARLGGDEFAVVCPGLPEEFVPVVAGRLRAAVSAPWQLPDGTDVQLGVSIGSATTTGRSAAQQLVNAADAAMYEVKRARAPRS